MAWNFPVYLNLEGRRCLVIGSGWSTPEKVRGLLGAGAEVTVLASEAAEEIETLAASGAIRRERREYQPGDLEGFFLAVATHQDRSRNEAPWRESVARNILFNAVDDPPRCGFSYPAIHRQGDITIAVSTNGKCPALGVRLRRKIEREVGPEYAAMAQMLGDLRGEIAARIPEFGRRKELWGRLVDSGCLERIRGGDADGARSELRALIEAEVISGLPLLAGESAGPTRSADLVGQALPPVNPSEARAASAEANAGMAQRAPQGL
jgi:siroheme synthase-like protein